MFLQRARPLSVLGLLEALRDKRQLPRQVLYLSLDAVQMTIRQFRHFRFQTLQLTQSPTYTVSVTTKLDTNQNSN